LRVADLVEASLCIAGRFRRVQVEDISLGGARILLAERLPPDAELFLTIEGLPDLPGTIRWQSGGQAGITFAEPLDLDTLAFWLAEPR
jgi:hypothetical protein